MYIKKKKKLPIELCVHVSPVLQRRYRKVLVVHGMGALFMPPDAKTVCAAEVFVIYALIYRVLIFIGIDLNSFCFLSIFIYFASVCSPKAVKCGKRKSVLTPKPLLFEVPPAKN